MLPLVTGTHWAEQLVATSSVVAAVEASAPGARLSETAQRQLGAFLVAWRAFQSTAQVPPLMPLPPPIPSVLVLPSAWQTLMGWDRAARAWATYLSRFGAELAPLAPPADPPPTVDPRSLGLDLGGGGIGFGLGLGAAVLLALFAMRR